MEYALVIAALLLGLGGPLLAIVLSIVALARTGKTRGLTRRVEQLEAQLRRQPRQPEGFDQESRAATARAQARPVDEVPVDEAPIERVEPDLDQTADLDQPADLDQTAGETEASAVFDAELVDLEPSFEGSAEARPESQAIHWEMLIGQKALGWAAIVLLILAAAFFLRYAYQNNWIGPVGRVAVGAMVGIALVVAGRRYDRRGWRLFSQMLTGGGIVVLYLATYSALGFYHLLPQREAGLFLVVIVVQSMIIAALYDSLAIALVAVLGGLLTPLLMHSDRDLYPALFTYIAVLDLGVVVLMLLRAWPAIGSVALLGSHGMFWLWHSEHYHPEKLAWALGFQAVIYLLFLAYTIIVQFVRRQRETWEGLARLAVAPALGFTAFYVLMNEQHAQWMGIAAVTMAAIYAALARVTFALRPRDERLLLTSLAIAVGFLALAFPIQADASWVAFGWAAMAAALWWFGLRIEAPALRVMAVVLAVAAVLRLLLFDLPPIVREPFTPIVNPFALPSIGVAACILVAVVLSRPFLAKLQSGERASVGAAGVVGVLLLWMILSVDCYGYFVSQSVLADSDTDPTHWRWLGQLSLSVLWAVYGSVVLAIGFWLRRAPQRWLALALYAVTITKVLLVDMANLDQFYRILAFLIVAIVLGLAARAYQRFFASPPAVDSP